MRQVARDVLDSLKRHPLALALVVINALFVVASAYAFKEISASAARRDQFIADLIADDCKRPAKGDRLK